jgi:hypothetical protein
MADANPTVKDFNGDENENTKESIPLAKSKLEEKGKKQKKSKPHKGKKGKKPIKPEDDEQLPPPPDDDPEDDGIDESTIPPPVKVQVAARNKEQFNKLDAVLKAKDPKARSALSSTAVPAAVEKVKGVELKDGQFVNFTPLQLTPEQTAEMSKTANQMRNGELANVSTVALGKTWQLIIDHVQSQKPIFFIGVPAGLPPAFFAKNPGATRSIIRMPDTSAKGIDFTEMPRGQFQFGYVSTPAEVNQLHNAGFMVVGCSGSSKYYSQNMKGNAEAFQRAMAQHRTITGFYTKRIISGFIHKPSPALSVLIDHVSENAKPETDTANLPE